MEVFILSFEAFQVIQNLFVRVFELEQFGTEPSRLSLRHFQIRLALLVLLLPVRQDLQQTHVIHTCAVWAGLSVPNTDENTIRFINTFV